MNYIALAAFSFLISMVPFSVAVNSSVYRCIVWKEALRMAIAFAFFQAGMTAIGWLVGYSVKGTLVKMDEPVAMVIFLFIGFRYFIDSRRTDRHHRTITVESNRIMYGFAFVTSINTALLSMGLGIIYPDFLVLLGFVFLFVFVMVLAGVLAGKRGMLKLGRAAETLAGLGLVAITVIIMLQYLKIM